MGKTLGGNSKYIPAVDGLRALAVIAVLLYHLRLPFAQCGLLGVTIFFVISGYLVTKIMLNQLEETGHLSFRHFWKRRIMRILPSILVMVVIATIVYSIFDRMLLGKMRPDIPSAIFLYNNWWQIFRDVSYFEAAGAPSPLTHCWSLAIEGQFYLIWPLIVVLLYKLPGRDKLLPRVTAVLTIISALLMVILFRPDQDPSRVYYGTDTRCFSLLMGAFMAMTEPQINAFLSAVGERKGKLLVDLLAIVNLAAIVLIVIKIPGYSAFLYRGGQFLVSICTMFLLLAVLQRGTLMSRVLGLPPFVIIGKMSYSLYIWHYPIIIFLSGGIRSSAGMTILETVLSFVFAAVSYYFIETPVRHGVIGRTVRRLRRQPQSEEDRVRKAKLQKKSRNVVAVTLVLVLASSLCLAFVPGKEAVAGSEDKPMSGIVVSDFSKKAEDIKRGEVTSYRILVLGDSVPLDAMDPLLAIFPNLTLDTEIGRHADAAVPLYESYVAQGWQGEAVIFALATNGTVDHHMADLREAMGPDLPLFIINTKAPYTQWQDSNNKEIKEFVDSHDHTYLIDWFGASKDHDEWFYDDKTHMNPEGSQAYADLVKATMEKVFVEEEK